MAAHNGRAEGGWKKVASGNQEGSYAEMSGHSGGCLPDCDAQSSLLRHLNKELEVAFGSMPSEN